MKLWKTASKRTLLKHSKFLSVEEHTVILPDGTTISDWPWVITPNFINVLAVTTDGMFPLFRQTKYAINGLSLAPVGGYIEPNEDPLIAAQRELREETGYTAPHWTFLGQYHVDANRGAGIAHLYLAQEAVFSGKTASDDLEEQKLLLLTRSEVETALKENAFKVLPWATVVALGLSRLNEKAP